MLRNPKGATSLRWLEVLLDGGIEVHGQIVICPGVNDGTALEDTLAGILDKYSGLSSVGGRCPSGSAATRTSPRCAPTRPTKPSGVLDTIEEWQRLYQKALGHRMVFAADEYYLLAGREVPLGPLLRGAIPSTRTASAWHGHSSIVPAAAGDPGGVRHGFFASVDSDRPRVTAPRVSLGRPWESIPGPSHLTGTYGARVLAPLVASHPWEDVDLHAIANDFFGGNIGVAGLLTGEDLARSLAGARQRALPVARCVSKRRAVPRRDVAGRPAEAGRSRAHRRCFLSLAIDGTSFRPVCGS